MGTIDTAEADGPGIRARQPGEQVDDRALAGAVGVEKTEQLAALHAEGDPRDCVNRIETFGQICNDNGVGSGRRLAYSHSIC